MPECRADDGETINVGELCLGSGECHTSSSLDNCSDFDVYIRVQSCAKDDEVTTPENVAIAIPVLDNDVDTVGEGLTIAEWTEPQHGTVDVVEGELVYEPEEGYSGLDDFTYYVIDGSGFLSDAKVDLTVTPVNSAPIANDDEATTQMGTNTNIPVLDNDTNDDRDKLEIDSVTQPDNGVSGIRPDGTIVYKPDADFLGKDEFTYKACNSEDQCDEATVTVSVLPPENEPPIAEDDSVIISAGLDPGPAIPVLSNDEDPDGDELVVELVEQPDNGKTEISPDGQHVIYTPNPDFNGEDQFEYTTCDDGGLCDTAQVTVSVEPGVENPNAFPDRESTNEDETIVVDVAENDLSPDDRPLVVTDITSQTENGKCTITSDGKVEYTPTDGFVGQDGCVYQICVEDTDACDEGELVVDVMEAPKSPPVAVDDPVTTDHETPITIDPTENDLNPGGGPLVVQNVTHGENGSCDLNEHGTVLYTPDSDATSSAYKNICLYTVCNDDSLCDEGAIIVSVAETNKPPDSNDDIVSTPQDTPVIVDVLDNDSDPDEDGLSISSVDQPLHGECKVVDDKVQYTPAEGYVGSDVCPYVACDSSGLCSSSNVVIEVEELQDAQTDIPTVQPSFRPSNPAPPLRPLAVDDIIATPKEEAVLIEPLENDRSPSGSPITLDEVSDGEHGTCEVVGGTMVEYTPENGYVGSDSCTYKICTSNNQCDEAEILISVTGSPNQTPNAEDDIASTSQNTPLIVDVIANDSDPDDDPLTIASVDPPLNGKCDIVNNQIQYSPDEDFVGGDVCAYVVCDEEDSCASANVVIDVEETSAEPSPTPTLQPTKQPFVPTPPFAVDDVVSTPQGKTLDIDPLDNDISPSGIPLVLEDVTNGLNGKCVIIDNKVQYTSNEEFVGEDSCIYTVCNQEDLELCDEAEIIIDVEEVETVDPPLAEDDTVSTPQDVPITIDPTDNDNSPTGGPLVVEEVSNGEHGRCEIVGNQKVQYLPDDGFFGVDSCSYTTCYKNDSELCDEAVIFIEVEEAETETTALSPTNEPSLLPVIPMPLLIPSAVDDTVSTPKDEPIVVDVIGNDSSPEDEPLIVTSIPSQAGNGVCGVTSDNKVEYSPEDGFVGEDSCKYEVCIDVDSCDTAKVIIEVEAPPTFMPTDEEEMDNSRPYAFDDYATTPQDKSVAINILENDFDMNGDDLTVISTTTPANGGRVEINPDGTVSFIPDAGFSGSDSFDYIITDGNGGTDTATVVVDVTKPITNSPSRQPSTNSPSRQPITRQPTTPRPIVLPPPKCEELCFEPLASDECPSCHPSILPSCSNQLEVGDLCESEGECGLSNNLNNCEGIWDVYRLVNCISNSPSIVPLYDVPTTARPTQLHTPPPIPSEVAQVPNVCLIRDGETITYEAVDDAYVSSRDENRLYNTETIMVDDAPKVDGLIRWKLSEDICECVTITKVTLRLYVLDPSPQGGYVHITNPNWFEESVTWYNANDSSGPPLANIGKVYNESWIDVDVTGLISTTDDYVSIKIESCAKNMVQYASKEFMQGHFAPQLVVEFGPPSVGLISSDVGISLSDHGCSKSLRGMDTSLVFVEKAVADATIKQQSGSESFGSEQLLEISSSPCQDMHALIEFDIGLFAGEVDYAALLIFVQDSGNSQGATFVQNNAMNWSEDSVTWQAAPEYEKVIGSLSKVDSGRWYEVDVTSAMKSMPSDSFSIRIVPSTVSSSSCEDQQLSFYSREHSSGQGPQLIIVPKDGLLSLTMSPEYAQAKAELPLVTVTKFEPADDTPTENIITPTDDASISYRNSQSNYGKEPELFVDGNPQEAALMKFDISSLDTATMTSATLKVYAIDGSMSGGRFHVIDGVDWDEDTITWGNSPSSNTLAAELTRVTEDGWYQVDLTDALKDVVGDSVTILIDSEHSNRLVYSSKEGEYPPMLVLTGVDGPGVGSVGRKPKKPRKDRLSSSSCQNPLHDDSLSYLPHDDAVIKEADGDKNFSRRPNLNVVYEVAARVDALVKFAFGCTFKDSSISKATLKLYCKDGSPKGGKLVSVAGSWSKENVTWNTAPITSTGFSAELGRTWKGEWMEVDVTDAFASLGDELTFRIEGLNDNYAVYGSSEDVAFAPVLEVFFEKGVDVDRRRG